MNANATKRTRRPVCRTVTCAPCEGTGVELGTRDGAIIQRDCFWCDGRGYHVLEASDDAPRVCGSCRRPEVVVEGVSVCPDCTTFVPTDIDPFA